jgi:trigger factor
VSLTYEISDIYITQEAELNEDLFKKVFPSLDINNIEDFRKELQSKIQLQYDSQSDLVFLRETIDKLIETVNVEMSETFLKKFIIHNNKDNEELIQDIEVNFDKYLKSVKQQFIEAKIFEVFDVKIGLDDYKDHIREFYKSAMNRTDVTDEQITSDLMQLLNDQQQKENLDEDVKNIKLIKVLKDNVSLSEIIHASYKDMINEFNKQNDKGKAVEADTESK